MRRTASISIAARLIYLVASMPIVATVPSAASAADVKITSPANGARIKGSDVMVTIQLSDVPLVPPSKATKREDLQSRGNPK